jgi:Tol biopolymer transport system component
MKLGKLLISIVIVSLLVSMAIPMAAAPPGGGGKPPKDPPTPANPVILRVSGRSQNELRVNDEDGSHETTILKIKTKGNWNYELRYPRFSPDGTMIAYASVDMNDQIGEVWVLDFAVVDGEPQATNNRKIVDCFLGQPAWSPDGTQIAFTNNPDGTGWTREIKVISSTDGWQTWGTPTTVYSVSAPDALDAPTWSRDGTQIAFQHSDQSVGDVRSIKLLDVASLTVVKTLIPDQFNHAGALDWGNTADVILFSGYLNPISGGKWVATVDVNTEVVNLIVEDGEHASWSTDDTKIVYVHRPGGDNHIRTLPLADPSQWTTITTLGHFPDWV